MRVLFLAPQPFFQERGTPIAVRLALEVLASRHKNNTEKALEIDLLTLHEGTDIEIPGVTLHRSWPPKIFHKFLQKVPPGISYKKLVCDLFFLIATLKLAFKNRKNQYKLVHAVEEGIFAALIIKRLFGVPIIYDMDSSLALQLVDKWYFLKPFYPVFSWFEKLAVCSSLAIAPVCDELDTVARRHGSKNNFILRDISLLSENEDESELALRKELNIHDGLIILYVGNLEYYQGVDLLIDSFSLIAGEEKSTHLVIIGGSDVHVSHYKNKVNQLGLEGRIHLTGPRSVSKLGFYIKQADILVSPRIKGNNTPMKIYSYLHSGISVLATNLPTHTQVLNDKVSKLVEPTQESFAQGMLELVRDSNMRERLGAEALALAKEKFTFEVFSQELNKLYDFAT